jgi:beta-lactamase class A
MVRALVALALVLVGGAGAATPAELQAAYDAARERGDWAQVRAVEAIDHKPGSLRLPAALPRLPATAPHLPTREDAALRAALERLGRGYRGWAAFWVADLRTGRYAGWNSDALFPAASLVKLGALAEGIRRFGHGPRSPIDYDLRQLGSWSSNLAANRIVALLGGESAVGRALQRLGMSSSTYPGPYRVGTSAGTATDDAPKPPPLVTWRTTTARDLGRALIRLQAAAAGERWAIAKLGLGRDRARAALGYLGLVRRGASLLALPDGTPVAEKDGWTKDVRGSAAIAYPPSGPRIVVVLAYRPGISAAEARKLGERVSRLVFG